LGSGTSLPGGFFQASRGVFSNWLFWISGPDLNTGLNFDVGGDYSFPLDSAGFPVIESGTVRSLQTALTDHRPGSRGSLASFGDNLSIVRGDCPAPEGVQGVAVNDGSAQRSRVTSLTVTFGGLVTLDPGAFDVLQQGGGLIGLDVTTSVVDGRTLAVLTFAGPDIVGGSLPDGSYTLVIRSDWIIDSLGQPLDGDGDGAPGGDHVESFFRLFGDGDGDADVDLDDVIGFFGTFRRQAGDPDFLWYFDHDGDDDVDEADLVEFAARYGTAL
jgi:hypothetical protein